MPHSEHKGYENNFRRIFNLEEKRRRMDRINHKICISNNLSCFLAMYSSVPNRRACTIINFEKKIHPARSYFGLHVYWFWEKNPPCTSILSCTFNVFLRIFPPARLFRTARLFGTLEYLPQCNEPNSLSHLTFNTIIIWRDTYLCI